MNLNCTLQEWERYVCTTDWRTQCAEYTYGFVHCTNWFLELGSITIVGIILAVVFWLISKKKERDNKRNGIIIKEEDMSLKEGFPFFLFTIVIVIIVGIIVLELIKLSTSTAC